MAADTAPAAVPDPTNTTRNATTQPGEPGRLASLLAPVEPARPAAFTITPSAGAPAVSQDVTGVSSAAFHGEENTPGKTTNPAQNSRPKESVIRAWLLAGAERWKKGAGANIKRLEVQKARAMAQQVKETRTLNRTEKPTPPAPKSSGGSTGGGPSKGPLKPQQSGGSGPKNTTGPGGGAGRTKTPTPAPAPSSGPKTSRAAKEPKAPAPSKAASTSTSSKPDAAPHKPGKTDPKKTDSGPARDSAAPGGKRSSGGGNGAGSAAKGSTSSGKSTSGEASRPAKAAKEPNPPRRASDPTKPTPDKSPAPGKVSLLKKRGAPAGDTSTSGTKRPAEPAAAKREETKKPEPQAKPDQQKQQQKKPATEQSDPKAPGFKSSADPKPSDKDAAAPDEAIRTRGSRETGYRDGARAGRAAAHMKAYRDGVKDGWADTQEAAAAEKARLDQAHAQRKQQRDKDTPVPTTVAPPKPTRAPAVPITVTSVDAVSVHLGDGANRTALARGEVRTLKKFERLLEAKKDVMQQVAERSRGLEAHATQQADTVTRLLEDAKGVKGGKQLLTALARLQDAANAQAGQAAEVHKRAARSADATGAVHTNAQTRYGAIYQAVVDSPLTKPAEGDFYREGVTA
ncbi:hypothetical protein [Streptomyces sp. NPDC056524]|uniref:hypothetical protein n=1 Tax=Streptomyces sp. NPDC056524 TaxID=3345851 RepID=UPI0036AE996A